MAKVLTGWAGCRGYPVALVVALAVVFAVSPAAAPLEPERIVAVGDIHGAFDALTAILQQAGLVDSKLHWVGGKATLVQTGDMLDRGPKPREVMDLLMALEKEAPKDGGRVVVLLGNHEVMNLFGDLSYVTPENYASFADKDSEKRRDAAYQAYMQVLAGQAQASKQPPPVRTPETEKEWKQAHPLGLVEHQAAFAPDGKYGRWLREHATITQLSGIIFLHGGISSRLPAVPLERVNNKIRDEIRAFDQFRNYLVERKLFLPFFTLDEMTRVAMAELDARKAARPSAQDGKATEPREKEKQYAQTLEAFLRYPGWFSVYPEGPLWFRDFALSSDEEEGPQVTKLLRRYGVAHFVVGHTPQSDGRIHPRFNGGVFLIDTGMLSSYFPGGRASALEIQNGKFTAIYLDQRTVLFEPPSASRPPIGDCCPAAGKFEGTWAELAGESWRPGVGFGFYNSMR